MNKNIEVICGENSNLIPVREIKINTNVVTVTFSQMFTLEYKVNDIVSIFYGFSKDVTGFVIKGKVIEVTNQYFKLDLGKDD